MNIKTLILILAATAGMACAQTVLVGGDTLNGNFNTPAGSGNATYAQEPYWNNIGTSDNSQVFLKDDEYFDGTRNAVLAETAVRLPGLDTGYTIQAGDVFSISYYWRDSFQWTDGGDQIKIRLFVTDTDSLAGTPTDLTARLSGISTANDTYEFVSQAGIYTADATVEEKTLFVALDTQDGGGGADGFARIDNFVLSVSSPPVVNGTITNNAFRLDWNSLPGSYYTVLHTTNMTNDWNTLEAYIPATSTTLEYAVALGSYPQEFFKVLKEPDLGPLVDEATPRNAQPTLATPTGDTWVLDFSDEFNGTAVDTVKWTVDNSTSSRAARPSQGINDWWWKPQNVSVADGDLILSVTKKDANTMWCGSINSNNKYEPQYGYLEARIQIADTHKSTHTAFWLQGDNMGNVDGTGNDGAEVDIFESAWFGDYTKAVVHIDGYGGSKQANTKQYSTPGIHSGYHVFGLEWTADSMKIYYDGVLKVTYTGIWVPLVPEFIWLSDGASFGDVGTFAGEPVGWLTDARVDYVRVWKAQ